MSSADPLEQRPSSSYVLWSAVLVVGLTALVAQVTLTRELLVVFLGNELSIAVVLAVWLVAVSAGSAVGAWLTGWLRSPARALAWSQVIIAAVLPLSLLLARRYQPPGLAPGEMLGPGAVLLASLQTLGPVAPLTGLQFVLAAAAATRRHGRDNRAGIGGMAMVYALEAAGSAAGGLIFHLYLAQHLLPFSAVAAVGLLNLVSASTLQPRRRTWPTALRLVVCGAIGAGLIWTASRGSSLELAAFRANPRWAALEPVAFTPSKYGALLVTRHAQQVSFYQSGVLLFTSQDDYANEVTGHLPLLEHPSPHRVLLIGGAMAGLAGEILKHPVQRLDCVELDPRVGELARRWLPGSLLRSLRDERVRLHVGDARVLVRRALNTYDVVILNLPDPTTAAVNRFYTQEFFQEARRSLRPGGILCIGITGSEISMSGPVLLAAATLDHTLGTVFPVRVMVPGDRTFFLAGGREAGLTTDWEVLSKRMSDRRISASFINETWLQDGLQRFRREMAQQTLSQVSAPRLNTDLNPVGYYYQTRIWLAQALARHAAWRGWRVPRWSLLVLLAGTALVLAVASLRSERVTILLAIGAVGGFGLMVELLALLVFQSACGYLYYALGILIATFMIGLAVGSAVMGTRSAGPAQSRRLLIAGVATALLLCLLLPGLLKALLATPSLASAGTALLLLFTGSLVGAMFPIAGRLYTSRQGVAAGAGAIYAVDLLGSAGAALVTGAVAVPLLGAASTCLIAAAAVGVVLVLLLLLLLRAR